MHLHLPDRTLTRASAGSARPQLERMIVGTYSEMPGLLLQLPQAARLFGLAREACQTVLDELVERRVLRRTRDGQYGLRGGE